MIWYYVLLFFVSMLNIIFSPLGVVTSLPTILGVNLDTQFSDGIGFLHSFVTYFWMYGDVMIGATILLSYYMLKMFLKLILGHRAPGLH